MKKFKPKSYEEFLEKYVPPNPSLFNFAFDVVDEKAKSNPEATAMIHVDDNGSSKTYSYGFFSRESNKLANVLAEHGIKKGDRVMLILYRRVEFWVAMLALNKIGAVSIPSPSQLTPKDIVYRVESADVKGIISEDSVITRIDAARPECPGIFLYMAVGQSCPEGWVSYETLCKKATDAFHKPKDYPCDDDPLLIFFSSGTSGKQKMVEHTNRYPLGHYTTAVYWHDLDPGDIHLTVADTGWGKAVWGKFYGQWMADAIVFVYDFRGKFDPRKLLEVISAHKVTTLCVPPTIYRFMVMEDLKSFDLSALRHCTTAGELLNASVFEEWLEKTGLSLYEGYGQTETTVQILTLPFMKPKPGSMGKPAPGWDIVLLDQNDQICPPGVEGEICVKIHPKRPLGFFTGYIGEANLTAEVTRNGLYHTGDKAWLDEDGYFWFMGRVDDLIKSSGYRIGPFEVESALVSHKAVIEAAVTGVPDPVRGQSVKATVVLAPGYKPSESLTKELQEHVRAETAPYKYPRIIEYVDALPKTINGKIRRVEIRERDEKKYKNN